MFTDQIGFYWSAREPAFIAPSGSGRINVDGALTPYNFVNIPTSFRGVDLLPLLSGIRSDLSSKLGNGSDHSTSAIEVIKQGGDIAAPDSTMTYSIHFAGGIQRQFFATTGDLRTFLVRYAAELFPETPVVFSRSDDTPDNNVRPPSFTGITYQTDLRGTMDIVRRLQPGVRRVFVVSGASQSVDKWHEARARKQFEGYYGLEEKQTIAYEFEYRERHFRTRIIPDYSSAGAVESVMSITEDFTERLQTELQLRKLATRLLNLQDEERRRIARDLHDGTAQNLLAVTLNLGRLERMISDPTAEMAALLLDSQQLTTQALTELRTLSYLLHPPVLDHAGLARAIRWFARGFSERTDIQVATDAVQDIGRLPQEVETALFRIVQESLTNVRRHSGSNTASIGLEKRLTEVSLQISDGGHGMLKARGDDSTADNAELGVGIPGMRQRLIELGGTLEIESSNNGTTINVVVPAVQPKVITQQITA